ncbi:dTDP-glucose 4,6-dehydratase [subsurface metagenome]
MKILVTGGSGFIGSHIVDVLLEEGYQVKIYDIEEPKYNQKCEYIKGDVLDLTRLIQESIGYDIIYHLVAEADVNRFYKSPYYSNLITSCSTISVLEAVRINKVSRVLLASTEWVYGSPESNVDEMITEDTPMTNNPDHIYTSSKIAAEMFCKNYKQLYGVNYTIMRFGIPFGERARASTVTPIFIRKILNDEEITIHGNGSQTRQFIYVKELARGCVACLHKNAENQIINLEGKERISVLNIVRNLEDILGKKAKLKFVEDRAGQFKGRLISGEKAKRLLGWKSEISYKDALKNYVEWFIKNKEHEE